MLQAAVMSFKGKRRHVSIFDATVKGRSPTAAAERGLSWPES